MRRRAGLFGVLFVVLLGGGLWSYSVKVAPTLPPTQTPTPTAAEGLLAQQVKNDLGPYDPSITSDTSCQKGFAYDERVTAALVHYLAAARELHTNQLAGVFQKAAGVAVDLYQGTDGLFLAYRRNTPCWSGSHDDYGYGTLMVINQAGRVWRLGGGQIVAARWWRDGWDVFVDENRTTAKSVADTYFLWRVEQQNNEWSVVARQNLTGEYSSQMVDHGFLDRTPRLYIRYRGHESTPPCQFPDNMRWYLTQLTFEVIYEWNGEAYIHSEEDTLIKTTVLISQPGGDYAALDNWESYCIGE